MLFYPLSKELQDADRDFSNGNFGLWFYKLIPLDDKNNFKPRTPRTNDKNVASFYRETYDRLKKNNILQKHLEKRHEDQQCFCRMHGENGARIIEIRAELKTPLIAGIGNTHPNEVGMTFDHTLGIPYLPSTSIKGVVRLAHILNLLTDTGKCDLLIYGEELDDTHPASLIPQIFGGDLKRENESEKLIGKVVFLDAYPEKVPGLHVDIMNPHYGDYYSDESAPTPPADYLDPNPIQFLTIGKGAVFIFRAVIQGNEALQEPVLHAFYKALADEGMGAKTATGYGRFKPLFDMSKEKQTTLSPEEERQPHVEPAEPQTETWENVILTWSPGNQEIAAVSGNNKATAKGKDLVPPDLNKKLFGKKKRAQASRVVVEPVGNAFKIVEINI